MTASGRVRVLIVDDSAVARDLLERGLALEPGIEVVGKASDAYSARDKIVFLKPDAMTLDVEMPRMDGIAFLRKLMPQYPIPVVVVSAVTAEGSRRAMDALEAGALSVVAKPEARDHAGLRRMMGELAERLKEAARADPEKLRAPGPSPAGKRSGPAPKPRKTTLNAGAAFKRVIAIGASTGGTVALARVVTALPAEAPPVLIVQHMPPVFTRLFADSMDRQSRVTVKEAEDGDPLIRGRVLVAPGDRHMRVRKTLGGYNVSLAGDGKVSGHRPSVDVLFRSVADVVGADAVAALLTGMGRDGADGLLAMKRAGARCVAQDEASSVIFGMPREAWENGAAEALVPIERMAHEIMIRAGGMPARGA